MDCHIRQCNPPRLQVSRANLGVLGILEGGWVYVVHWILDMDLPILFSQCYMWSVCVWDLLLYIYLEECSQEEAQAGKAGKDNHEHRCETQENGRTAE